MSFDHLLAFSAARRVCRLRAASRKALMAEGVVISASLPMLPHPIQKRPTISFLSLSLTCNYLVSKVNNKLYEWSRGTVPSTLWAKHVIPRIFAAEAAKMRGVHKGLFFTNFITDFNTVNRMMSRASTSKSPFTPSLCVAWCARIHIITWNLKQQRLPSTFLLLCPTAGWIDECCQQSLINRGFHRDFNCDFFAS